jgi:hypothetical protein
MPADIAAAKNAAVRHNFQVVAMFILLHTLRLYNFE